MQVIDIAIEELQLATYNPRQLTREQYNHLKESIERFGLVDPIIVNDNEARKNIVIGGHQRLQIAKDLGFTTVPVVYLNLDEPMERELNVRLNKNTGEWNMDILANEFPEALLTEIGFSDIELHGIPEEEPEPPAEKKGWTLKCPQCGFGGNEDAYEKIEDEGPKEI
jgi:ParB-like chromosome segregation protein Spo0J